MMGQSVSWETGQTASLARFLDYVQGHGRVWSCRRVDTARYWYKEQPYKP